MALLVTFEAPMIIQTLSKWDLLMKALLKMETQGHDMH